MAESRVLTVEVSEPDPSVDGTGVPGDGYIAMVLVAACSIDEIAARLPVAVPPPTVAVRITGDSELRRLNREFLGEDHPTDVLSFPSGDPGTGELPLESGAHLGDLAVSWPAVLRQAEEFGHPPGSELALLLVHGLLHLLGWDHAEPAEEAEMTRITLAALAAAGVEISPRRI